MATGICNKEIAARLTFAAHLGKHVENLLRITAHIRTQLVAIAGPESD